MEVAPQRLEIDANVRPQRDLNDVVLGFWIGNRAAVTYRPHLGSRRNDAFGQKEAEREVLVVPGSAHRDHERRAGQTDLERFLARHEVVTPKRPPVAEARHFDGSNAVEQSLTLVLRC